MRITAFALILSVFSIGVDAAFAQKEEATAWQQVAVSIPLGTRVRVQMGDGRRVSGTLMRVDDTSVMLKRNTRRPEPAVVVPFSEMAKFERDKPGNGTQIAKAIGVGLAAGAGVFFSLVLIALQLD
jgi:ribosome maturation factor RimP